MKRVRLDAIVFDAGTQVRAALDQDHVASLADAMMTGAAIPPIVLFHDGSRHYIGDGFHRYMAAQRLQWREIDAEVRPGAREDALWFALGANRTNGKNMTLADKRHAIVLALETWPDYSTTRIAEQVGCGQQYVSTIREQVTPMRNLPSRVTGKDGKSYPASRPRAVPQMPPPDRDEDADAPHIAPSSSAPTRRAAWSSPPPSNGLQFARIAIMKLAEIRDDDTERQHAFDMVRRWIDAREAKAAMHA